MDLTKICISAKEAKYEVAKLTTEQKNATLLEIAKILVEHTNKIMMENAKDITRATAKGMSVGLIDRLRLDEGRIADLAEGMRQVAGLPDPVGEIIETTELKNGLKLEKCRVPMGVIGIIYESRPNVTTDAFALCFKAGSSVILKGGSDSINSNIAITECIKEGLRKCNVNESTMELIDSTDRATTIEFMHMKDYVDVLIPRGGAGLIKSVVENSTIPVIETGTGNCHIYIDETADLKMAKDIVINAKTQRIGVCNACESLVVHEAVKDTLLVEVAKALSDKNVEIKGDECAVAAIGCIPADETDFATEYLALKISVKTVSSIEEAITHINHYSTGHSETIITNSCVNAEKFLNEIDSACVYANASTRFTDGFEFGLGAEIGISTQKLHARGPMGLKEITSYKYKIRGNGQIR